MIRFTIPLTASAFIVLATSCSVLQKGTSTISKVSNAATSKIIPGRSNNSSNSTPATLLSNAVALDSQGELKKAQDLYKRIAKSYPQSKEAPEASFRKADSMFRAHKLRDSFDAYQDFLSKHKNSHHYATALKRQEEIAYMIVNAKGKKSLIGFQSGTTAGNATKILEKVIANAPQAPSASKAQYKIAEAWDQTGNFDKALAGYQKVPTQYPSSKYAPQALYNTGSLLVRQKEAGNRNQANIGRAKEAFYDLVNLYPSSNLVPEARKQISELDRSDVQRSFDTAQFYEKKGESTAAIFCYKEVLRRVKSGVLHDRAKEKINSLSR